MARLGLADDLQKLSPSRAQINRLRLGADWRRVLDDDNRCGNEALLQMTPRGIFRGGPEWIVVSSSHYTRPTKFTAGTRMNTTIAEWAKTNYVLVRLCYR